MSLELVPFGVDVLAALAARRSEEAERLLGLPLPPDWPDAREAPFFALRAREARDSPASLEWPVHGVVVDGKLVGHAGFHGPPGHNGPGHADAVEIGYMVFPAWRGRGYAQAAARALVELARQRGVARVLASISPGNAPSLAVARKVGFVETGEQCDEEHGRELVFELSL